jgi:cytochrome P450
VPRKSMQLDVISAEEYGAHGYPHSAWARLRREAPVARIEQDGFDPFWAITKHADVIWVSRQPEVFLNGPRMTMLHNSVRPPAAVRQDPNFRPMIRTLLNMDNPDHRAYRKLVSGWFTPRAIAHLETRIEDIARGILDDLEARAPAGECDFVGDVAARLPLRVIAEILGVPAEDEAMVLRLSNQGIGSQDPEFQADGKSARESSRAAIVDLFNYFSQLAERRRATPRDDLVTVLANATVRGAPLPPLELLSYFGLIAVAGHETTRNATSGGLAAFLDHPDQWRRLRVDLGRVPTAVEEILRWTSPVIQFARTAARDVEFRGQHLRAGDTLVLFYPAANRDEEVFADAASFHIDRDPNPHIAFGMGEHLCLGAHLARLELRVLFRQLAERLAEVESAGPRSHLASSFVGGIKHLPIGYRFRAPH